jgi:hypothetical protein
LEYIKNIYKYGNTDYLIVNITNNLTEEELNILKEKSIYFPAAISKNVRFYFTRGIKILKRDGLFSLIDKAVFHLPKICAEMLSPIRHPKREKYSNEWV